MALSEQELNEMSGAEIRTIASQTGASIGQGSHATKAVLIRAILEKQDAEVEDEVEDEIEDETEEVEDEIEEVEDEIEEVEDEIEEVKDETDMHQQAHKEGIRHLHQRDGIIYPAVVGPTFNAHTPADNDRVGPFARNAQKQETTTPAEPEAQAVEDEPENNWVRNGALGMVAIAIIIAIIVLASKGCSNNNATAAPTATPTVVVVVVNPTDTPTDTPEPTATPTDTPEPTATPTDTPEPTATTTNTPAHNTSIIVNGTDEYGDSFTDRLTLTNGQILTGHVPPYVGAELEKIQSTWVSYTIEMPENACFPVAFGYSIKVNGKTYSPGALLMLPVNQGKITVEILDGELILWRSLSGMHNDIEERISVQIELGNLSIKGPLAWSFVSQEFTGYVPIELLKERKVEIVRDLD